MMRGRTKKPDILYEDEAVLVCTKPAGMAVESARTGQTDLVSALKTYRSRKHEEPYIGVVHRLDQPVEGVMVFAKAKAAAASLSKQVAGRQADKEYLAVLDCESGAMERMLAEAGQTEDGRYLLEDTLLRDGRTNTSRVVPEGTQGAKKARLTFEILEQSGQEGQRLRCLVSIRLETGRHHQIRVQFSSRGCPLYADQKYGRALPEGTYCPVALCSCKIGFTHPVTKKKMEFTIDPRERFRAYLR